jgi:hypothetical protein
MSFYIVNTCEIIITIGNYWRLAIEDMHYVNY